MRLLQKSTVLWILEAKLTKDTPGREGKVQGAKSECTGSLLQVNDQARISQATKQFACYATVSNRTNNNAKRVSFQM